MDETMDEILNGTCEEIYQKTYKHGFRDAREWQEEESPHSLAMMGSYLLLLANDRDLWKQSEDFWKQVDQEDSGCKICNWHIGYLDGFLAAWDWPKTRRQ